MRTCGQCGLKVIPDSARADKKFCSGACRVAAHRAGLDLGPAFRSEELQIVPLTPVPVRVRGTCAVCGVAIRGQRRVSCSQKCANRLNYLDRRARHASAIKVPYSIQGIYDRDSWICGLCNGSVDPDLIYPNPEAASIDHVIPLSRGGDDAPDNVQLAHFRCNWAKGSNLT